MTRSSHTPTTPKQRRALTPSRQPGQVESGGDGDLARELEIALRAAQSDDDDVADSLTHPVHTYPARMHPATARRLVDLVVRLAPERDGAPAVTLLDPFCGSGTVLVEARQRGVSAVGVDANPLAVLIARAKIWDAPARRRRQLAQLGERIAGAALAEGKAARRAGHEPTPLRTLPGVDGAQRDRRLADWFAPHVRRELEFLAAQIDELRRQDAELADVATVALSAILYKVSRRASDTDPRAVERKVGRGQAARLFRQRVAQLVAGLDGLAAGAPPAFAHLGDARALGDVGLTSGTVAAAVTSPPYVGTYDYAEQHRLRLDFLALPTAPFHRAEIGSRSQFADAGPNRRRARRRFFRAMAAAMSELARTMCPGAHAAIMLGDSIAGDRVMWADESLAHAIDRTPWTVQAWASQSRPKLGNQEYQLFTHRQKRECIFLLRRDVLPTAE